MALLENTTRAGNCVDQTLLSSWGSHFISLGFGSLEVSKGGG